MNQQQPTRIGDVPVFRTLKVIADLIRDYDLRAPITISSLGFDGAYVHVRADQFDAWSQAMSAASPVQTHHDPDTGARHWHSPTPSGLDLVTVTNAANEHLVTTLITEPVSA